MLKIVLPLSTNYNVYLFVCRNTRMHLNKTGFIKKIKIILTAVMSESIQKRILYTNFYNLFMKYE